MICYTFGSGRCPPFNFSEFLNNACGRYSMTTIRDLELDALCTMFSDLVKSLPKDQIVFVLIDGINFYEYGDRKQETLFAIAELVKVANSTKSRVVCKILVTSAAQSLAVGQTIAPEVLTLAKDLDREDQGFNVKRTLLRDGETMRKQGKLLRLNSHPDELEEEQVMEEEEEREVETKADSGVEEPEEIFDISDMTVTSSDEDSDNEKEE